VIQSNGAASFGNVVMRLVRITAIMAILAFAFITVVVLLEEGHLLIVRGSALMALGGGLVLVALHFVERSKVNRT